MSKPVGSSDDAVILRYMLEVEELTGDPTERWGMLKGMVMATIKARANIRKYQRNYKRNQRTKQENNQEE